MVTRFELGIFKPKTYLAIKHPLPYADMVEPTGCSQANKDLNWRNAMYQELNALIQNGTWTLVPSKSYMSIFGCIWVFKLKRKVDGSIDKYKSRLVAKGFSQKECIDYQETFN